MMKKQSIFQVIVLLSFSLSAASAFAGDCKIPKGDLDFMESHDATSPVYSIYAAGGMADSRIAPSDNCSSVEIWSFPRENSESAQLKKAPATCNTQFSQLDKKSLDDWVYCYKVPYFKSYSAATKAGAQSPFAYLSNGAVVIDGGNLFSTHITSVYEQKSKGRVLATYQYSQSMSPSGTGPAAYDNYLSSEHTKTTPADTNGDVCHDCDRANNSAASSGANAPAQPASPAEPQIQ